MWEWAETGALGVVGCHQLVFQVGGEQWDQRSYRNTPLQTLNHKALCMVVALWDSCVPCQMLEGAESLWTES